MHTHTYIAAYLLLALVELLLWLRQLIGQSTAFWACARPLAPKADVQIRFGLYISHIAIAFARTVLLLSCTSAMN